MIYEFHRGIDWRGLVVIEAINGVFELTISGGFASVGLVIMPVRLR
jgi:hypothetical protein